MAVSAEAITVKQVGDCEVHEGMMLKGAWMAPWLDKTLISLANRVKEGYTMIAAGTEAYLISPANNLYKYNLIGGLYHPVTSNVPHGVYVVKPKPLSNVSDFDSFMEAYAVAVDT